MKSEKTDKRQEILLTIIAILTLFFAVVGATFAYFTILVTGNEETSSVKVHAAQLGQVIFEDGQVINIKDTYPGDIRSKTFTIKSEGSDVELPFHYMVYLVQTRNDFAARGVTSFVHEISASSKESDSDESVLGTLLLSTVPSPASSAPIFEGTLFGNETHTYTYRIGLIESNTDQNIAQGAVFSGVLQVQTDQTNKYTSGGSF